jgi:hypothetical protein
MMELPQVPTSAPRCTHLQAKALAVHGEEFENDADLQGGTTDFTCVKTGRPLGPDNQAVGTKGCSDPDRKCYEEY